MASISQIKLPNNSVYDIKAKYDISGNIISDTYLRKDFDSIGHNVSFNSSVDIDDLTAGTLLVTGAARFTNGLIGNLKGTASAAPWSGITGKPSTYPPSAHTHIMTDITDWGTYVYSAQSTRTKNTVLAAPNGVDGKATFRNLVSADIPSLDASKITSGVFDIARLPQGALERLTIVADDTARFKLTSSNIQKGDTVKVTSTGKMYYVIDETKLSSEAGYEVYAAGTAASVPWSGVTSKPTTLSGYGITDALSSSTKYALSDSVGGNALKAISDANGNNINSTYLKMFTSGGLRTCSGDGKYNYFKIATIKISNYFINRPIVFELSGRGKHFSLLSIRFNSSNTNDPGLSFIQTNNDTSYWIKKVDTSTWEVYGAYSEVWGSCCLHRVAGGADIRIAINMTNINALPSECIQAIPGGSVGYATKATQDGNGNVISSTYLPLTGGRITGDLCVMKFITGEPTTTNHRILIGHANQNYMNFYEFGGLFQFYKSVSGTDTLLGKITSNGWEGNVVGNVTGNLSGNASSATKATQDGAGNVITSKYVTIDTTQTISGAKIFSKETTISSTTASTSKTTGALKVKGGIASEGQISADKVMIGDKCTLEYDANLQCLNFVFA